MKDAKGHGSDARGGRRTTQMQGPRRQQSARQERINMRRATDERRYPTTSTADRLANTPTAPSGPVVPLGLAAISAKGALLMARLNAGDIPAHQMGTHLATHRKKL